MQICLAQTNPVPGNIQRNIDQHLQLIKLAASRKARMIVFPELSLTGYEPALAGELATDQHDSRLAPFQQISDREEMIIGVGLPVKTAAGIAIGMVIFQAFEPPLLYTKKWIHADEEPYFIGASHFTGLLGGEARIALGICYELSVPEHAAQAFQAGAKIYLTSVSKLIRGIDKTYTRLAEIARTYSLTVLMANQTGLAEGERCAGRTAVWNDQGELIAQLDEVRKGILLIDTDTQEVIMQYLDQA
ncbi:MAG: carbon-nitrogen hydrolase family protein [Williamsia sp.]|nr:carbon-nitrogen hydrolase family protein [Williamsia sp.]